MRQTDTWSWFRYDTNLSIPKSTTHSSLEKGFVERAKVKVTGLLKNQGFNMDDYRLDLLPVHSDEPINYTTSYQRDYMHPKGNQVATCPSKMLYESPDWLFNRRPPNPFEMVQYTPAKFMDDKLFNISENRKKIDFFRQLRNRHFIMG